MSQTYEECYERTKNLILEFERTSRAELNEDTTRLRFIDAIFVSVRGRRGEDLAAQPRS
jgi:hypothetical protein